MSLKIGNINLEHGLILAPMAGVTDRVFRNICAQHGAEYTVSEMVCAKSLCCHSPLQQRQPSRSCCRLYHAQPVENRY